MDEYMKYIFGLALAGGGARGAYAAGVLRYLYTELPKTLGETPWPKLVSGTSVGALNGYFAACHDLDEVERMREIWQNISIQDIFSFYKGGTFGTIRYLLGISNRGYILNQAPLRTLIEKEASRRTLRKSIAAKKCLAYVVSATHLQSGAGTLFVETADPNFQIPPPPFGKVEYQKIYPQHLVASAAIPVLFPPEEINGQFFIDGGVRQNAPLHPILYGGAERILVVGTRFTKSAPKENDVQPTLSLIVGKTLNALTLDPIERDARSTDLINSIIDWGVERYGKDFASHLLEEKGLRKTKIIQIQPSVDLGRLVMDCYKPELVKTSKNIKWLLNKLYAQGQDSGDSDLLSQILFDKCYTGVAEQIGFEDAQKQQEKLISFFDD
jgi:NTE family protein